MKRTAYFAFIFLRIIIFIEASGYYSVVSPGTIQSNTDFSVGVTLHENSEPVTFKVAIVGESYNDAKNVDVSPSEMKIVNFQVPHIQRGKYNLTVNGVKGMIFENTTKLAYKDNQPKVYIQSDKAIYKPGDLIRYRIVLLDAELKPVKPQGSIQISIKDGAGSIVEQIKDVMLYKGVYSGKFSLSEEPVMGNWVILVSLSDNAEITEKKFKVAKYELGKLNFDIETASDITYEDPIKVTVRAKYTTGKHITGRATITATNTISLISSEKTIDIDGEGYVQFDLKKDLQTVKSGIPQHLTLIKLAVTIIETLTNNILNSYTNVNVHGSPYVIHLPQTNTYSFHPNIQFDIDVAVGTIYGKRPGGSRKVILIIDKNTAKNSSDQPLEGQIILYGELDEANRTSITVVLLDLNKEVIVEVNFKKPATYFVYAIVARGNIIKHEVVKLSGDAYEIKFMPSILNVPASKLYVYTVIDGDFKFSEIILNFPKVFQNKLKLTAPDEVKPSDKVTLNIKSAPNSFVCLMGVEKGVHLLNIGNDLKYDKIFEGLDAYSTITPHIGGFGDYPGATSGVVTLTNARYFYIPPKPPAGKSKYNIMPATADRRPGRPKAIPAATPHVHTNVAPTEHSLDIVVRQNIDETWLFLEENTDANGVATVTKQIPDTMTSWVVTGFSINEKTGFGMVESPTKIRSLKPFFVTLNLPYAVKRGEVIAIPIVVFNYMEKALDAEVTMENTDAEYDFTEVSNEVEEKVLEDKQRVKKVAVPANGTKSVSFMIRAHKAGEITLKIKAVSALASDTIHKKLKVEPEGVTQYANKAIFLTDLSKETLKVDIPENAVMNSQYLEFSVVGDMLGPTIQNIHQLVRLPSGCGEQNMINFVPNILVLKYLQTIGSDVSDTVKQLKTFMKTGYQRQLTFKHANGGYSSFGEHLTQPNNWITAYVARYFIQAEKYITIDKNAIERALEYLLSTQLSSGEFKQTGRLLMSSHQNAVGFTAFALLALLEDRNYSKEYKTQIDKGVAYIIKNIDKETDTYALAIAALALTKAQHSSAVNLMTRLEGLAQKETGLKWWVPTPQSKYNNNAVEITSYVLQAYLETEPFAKLLPIVTWLLEQRNNLGGFDTTQDTVVGLQALVSFAEKHSIKGGDPMTITFVAADSAGQETTKGSFKLANNSLLSVKTHVLPQSTRQVTLEAQGDGFSLAYLSYQYNLNITENQRSFKIKHSVERTLYPNQLVLHLCVTYAHKASNHNKESNMIVMEIHLSSGFIAADNDELQCKRLQRVETKNEDTVINVYFEYLVADEELCIQLNADESQAVAKHKPSVITVYDYYNTDERATVYYEVESSLCSICQDSDCGNACAK